MIDNVIGVDNDASRYAINVVGQFEPPVKSQASSRP